ncbi:MAG: hypothetical protein ACLFVC_04480 [Opitutales bacterium]
MKTTTILSLGALWIASIGIGYWIGASRNAGHFAVKEDPSAMEGASAAASDRPSEDSEPDEDTRAGDPPPVEDAPLTVASLSMSEVPNLSPDEVRDLLKSAFAMPRSDPNRSALVNDLLAQLARTNPEEALELADGIESFRENERARIAILESWGETDPVAALAWADTALADVPGGVRFEQMRAIYRGYAVNNSAAAFEATRQLPDDTRAEARMRSEFMKEVFETQISKGDVTGAVQAMETLEAGSDLRNDMLGEIVDEWASFDPESAAAYVSGLEGEVPGRVKTSLVEEWAESDPAAAAAWLSELPADDPAIARSTAEIVREWARYDLTASAEWLNSLPASPELDRAVASYAFRAAHQDPASAMTWAESITNDRVRGGMMERVAATWRSEDPESFQAFIDESEMDAEQKERLRKAEPWRGWRRWR